MTDKTIVDWQKRLGERGSREITTIENNNTVERLPDGLLRKIGKYFGIVDDHEDRLERLENRPEPLIPQHDNDAIAVPAAFGQLVDGVAELAGMVEDHDDRLDDVEVAITALAEREAGSSTNVNVTDVQQSDNSGETAELAAAMMTIGHEVLSQNEALRRRVIEMEREQLDQAEKIRKIDVVDSVTREELVQGLSEVADVGQRA